MTRAVRMKLLIWEILKFGWLITTASSSEVVIFETSAGWKRTGPNANHDREPLTSTPRKMTATSRKATPAYSHGASPSHQRAGMTKRMRPARPKAVTIQTSCLPLRVAKSRADVPSAAWLAE